MFVVCGATGHTGKVVAETLLARGRKVRAIARTPERLQSLTSKGAEAFAADFTDVDRLTKAFRGAEGAYVMVPPLSSSDDYRAFQDKVSDAIAGAVKNSGVKYVVSLSSFGVDKTEGTGPVVGLRNLELKLNQISGANCLHLRAGYFMTNTLPQAEAIRMMGMCVGPVRPDLKLPFLHTRDIGAAAADALLKLDFNGNQNRELQGPRDLDYNEAASIIGKAIGKPELKYVQIPDDQARQAMVQMGLSENFARLILEMAAALNSGHMRMLESRSARNTTPTPFEAFVAEDLLPLYRHPAAA